MKGLRIGLVMMAAMVVALGVTGLAYAFHSGGVAECEGCHSMHNPAPGGFYLLIGTTQSAACLTCHEHAGDTGPNGYHISTATADLAGGSAPKQRTPGGDFGWLHKSFSWLNGTVTETEDGSTHGHNIIAPDFGYNVDPVKSTAPGGTFPSAQLQCNSCHDPHGQYRRLNTGVIAKNGGPIWASGSYYNTSTNNVADNEPKSTGEAVGVYRLLAGAGYTKDGITFPGVPPAKVPSTYNRTEATTQTRVAYGNSSLGGHATWGNWCATCHPAMHSAGNYVHPVDINLGSTIATNYGSYVKSGDMTGVASSSFLSVVPFVENSSDYTVLAGHARINDSQLGGPVTADKVSCLSCHRAHASAWPEMLRFSYGYEFVTKNGQYVATDHPDYGTWGTRAPLQAMGRTIADMTAGYYDRPATKWATYQRVLCNKCHAKD